MHHLQRCTELWGSDRIVRSDPSVAVFRDVFYLPFVNEGVWGLFSSSGEPVADSVDFRDAARLTNSQILNTDLTLDDVTEVAPSGSYIYGGRVNLHYGHFLINTLPRFWSIASIRSPGTPILCHGPADPAAWFSFPFVAAAFGLLGLTVRDFVVLRGPTRLRNVVVPRTSLEEQRSAHVAYRALCVKMGERIHALDEVDTISKPAYYSKTKLKSGVGRIDNELEIEQALSARGVDIIYPETLSLEEQVREMSRRRYVLGSAGSFLHTSIFCPPRNITCLNVTSQINSNYSLIDRLAGNAAGYYYPPAMQVLGQSSTFLTARHLIDAPIVADELLDIALAG